ncbi:MAG: hypothetical protein ACXVAX_01840 [Pseudobdellovibrio sp.]
MRLRLFNSLTLVIFAAVNLHAQTAIDNQVNQNDAEAANAQTATTDANKKEKKQSLNFEDELIEGSAMRPDLFSIFQKNNFKFKKLIKLRENFLPEMARNAEDIQRLRGGR